jgi:hypothetical protein
MKFYVLIRSPLCPRASVLMFAGGGVGRVRLHSEGAEWVVQLHPPR